MERVKGIEPSSQAWEAHILPLNHTRIAAAAARANPFLSDPRSGCNRFNGCQELSHGFQAADGLAQFFFNGTFADCQIDFLTADFADVEVVDRRAAFGHDARGGDVQ